MAAEGHDDGLLLNIQHCRFGILRSGRQVVDRLVDLLSQQISALDRHIAGLIAEDQTLAAQASLLSAVPGIRIT